MFFTKNYYLMYVLRSSDEMAEREARSLPYEPYRASRITYTIDNEPPHVEPGEFFTQLEEAAYQEIAFNPQKLLHVILTVTEVPDEDGDDIAERVVTVSMQKQTLRDFATENASSPGTTTTVSATLMRRTSELERADLIFDGTTVFLQKPVEEAKISLIDLNDNTLATLRIDHPMPCTFPENDLGQPDLTTRVFCLSSNLETFWVMVDELSNAESFEAPSTTNITSVINSVSSIVTADRDEMDSLSTATAITDFIADSVDLNPSTQLIGDVEGEQPIQEEPEDDEEVDEEETQESAEEEVDAELEQELSEEDEGEEDGSDSNP